jgi:hypothetical protein
MTAIDVRCDGNPDQGWTCEVTLSEDGRPVSTHAVRVPSADLARLAPAAGSPDGLVEQSFVFLLEREPPQSILRSFDLLEIARYFPEYEADIKRRVRPR